MTTAHNAAPTEWVERPTILRVFKGISHAVAFLVLVMAFLAGRGQFVDRDFIDIHGILGNVIVLLAGAQVVLAFLTGLPRPQRAMIIGLNVLLAVLIIAQIGLGYSGRESAEAAAWHLPNGVLIFGLAVANSVFMTRLRR